MLDAPQWGGVPGVPLGSAPWYAMLGSAAAGHQSSRAMTVTRAPAGALLVFGINTPLHECGMMPRMASP